MAVDIREPIAIVCAFDLSTALGYSHLLVAQEVQRVFAKKGVIAKLYNFQERVIPEKNVLFVGTYMSNVLTYLTRFHEKKVVFYASVEGFPILDERGIERRVAERITTVANSHYTKMCIETGKLKCDGVVYLGIDMNDVAYDKDFESWIVDTWTKGRKTVLYVTGNMPRKAVDKYMLISKLVQAKEDACFILHSGGGPPPAVDVRGMAEQLQLNDFWFTNGFGLYSAEKMNALYHLSSVYAQSSYCEGFGRPMIEAMRFKLPVVAVDAQPFNEVVEKDKTGLLVPCKNVEGVNWMNQIQLNLHQYSVDDFAEAVLTLLREKALTKRMKPEIAFRCSEFDSSNTYIKLLEYF